MPANSSPRHRPCARSSGPPQSPTLRHPGTRVAAIRGLPRTGSLHPPRSRRFATAGVTLDVPWLRACRRPAPWPMGHILHPIAQGAALLQQYPRRTPALWPIGHIQRPIAQRAALLHTGRFQDRLEANPLADSVWGKPIQRWSAEQKLLRRQRGHRRTGEILDVACDDAGATRMLGGGCYHGIFEIRPTK